LKDRQRDIDETRAKLAASTASEKELSSAGRFSARQLEADARHIAVEIGSRVWSASQRRGNELNDCSSPSEPDVNCFIIAEGQGWWARLEPYLDYPGFEAWKFINLAVFVMVLIIAMRKFGVREIFAIARKPSRASCSRSAGA